jgi:hypothetical protein
MEIVNALILMWVVHFVVTMRDKEPAKALPEVIEDARKAGFFHSVFGAHPLSLLLGFVAVTAYGLLVGKWWLGGVTVAADLILGALMWAGLVRMGIKS